MTLRENHNAFHRLWLKPRVMVNVSEIDTTCTILGTKSVKRSHTACAFPLAKLTGARGAQSFPVYLSAVAVQGMGHPDGELTWTRAAAEKDIIFVSCCCCFHRRRRRARTHTLPKAPPPHSRCTLLSVLLNSHASSGASPLSYQMVPSFSTIKYEKIIAARAPEQTLWYQLYVNPSRESVCKEQVQKAQHDGCKVLFITVDAPQLGRRERDMRNKAGTASEIHEAKKTKMEKTKGTSAQVPHPTPARACLPPLSIPRLLSRHAMTYWLGRLVVAVDKLYRPEALLGGHRLVRPGYPRTVGG